VTTLRDSYLAGMKVALAEYTYHYAPKDAPILEEGLRAPRALHGTALESVMERYRPRAIKGLRKKNVTDQDVLNFMDTKQGLSRNISMLAAPVTADAPKHVRQFTGQRQLYKIDYGRMLRDKKVKGALIVEEKRGGSRKIAPAKLLQELDKAGPGQKERGLYIFTGRPHAKIFPAGGVIPPAYLTKVSAAAGLLRKLPSGKVGVDGHQGAKK
jgi:hypothetical protein